MSVVAESPAVATASAVAEAHPLSGLPGPSILPFLTRDVESHLCKDDEALSIMRKTEEQDRGRAEARTRFLDVVVAAHGAFRAHFDYQRKLMKQLCKDVVKEVNPMDKLNESQFAGSGKQTIPFLRQPSLDEIIEVDLWARRFVKDFASAKKEVFA